MTTLQDIFSEAQKSLGDLAFRQFQRQEWVDWAEDVFFAIAEDCKVFPEQKIYTPNPLAVPLFPAPSSFTAPAADAILRTTRVKRNGVDCREYSFQAIRNASEGIYPFRINAWELSGENFAAVKNADDSYTLHFASAFEPGETVIVDYVKEGTALSGTFNDTLAVPHYMKGAVLAGLRSKALEQLFFLGKLNGTPQLYQTAETKYDRARRDLAAYIYNLKDEGSATVVEPFRFLSED